MEKTGNRGGLKLVLGIIILVVAIIALVVALSSCSGDDADKDVAENNPPVVDNADDGEDADNGEDNAPAGNGGSGSRPTGSGSNAPAGGSTPPAGDNAGTETGNNASLQDWIEYIRHYDDNVENGVESATDDFTDMIDQVGNQMSNGNYKDGFDQFGSGLKDYAGGIIGSLTP